MSNTIKKTVILASLMILLLLCPHTQISSRENDEKNRLPEGVYIELTRDFYEAMKDRGTGGQTVYTNDPSIEYLREISVSSRFAVETNLQIIRQQERIISLLETIAEKKSK